MSDIITTVYLKGQALYRAMARRYAPDEDDAADLLSDTYLKLLERDREQAFETEDHARASLITSLRNAGIDRTRHAKVTAGQGCMDAAECSEPVAAASETDDRYATVMALIDKLLPPEMRRIYLLYEQYGWEQAEIAEHVGKSPEAVRQTVKRARDRIRQAVRELHNH